jgi:hypothetical protein
MPELRRDAVLELDDVSHACGNCAQALAGYLEHVCSVTVARSRRAA